MIEIGPMELTYGIVALTGVSYFVDYYSRTRGKRSQDSDRKILEDMLVDVGSSSDREDNNPRYS